MTSPDSKARCKRWSSSSPGTLTIRWPPRRGPIYDHCRDKARRQSKLICAASLNTIFIPDNVEPGQERFGG